MAENGPLEIRDAIGWTLRAAITLWALHEDDILHGRVSPAAILVEDLDCRSEGLLVRPSKLVDAPEYQSIERAAGAAPSKQDDVWALGVTLYFALTGKPPYPQGVAQAVHDGRPRGPAPLAVHRAALDVMQPVIDRLILADRADRLVHAVQVVAGLRDLSPAIADLGPLAIERAFDETDIIEPVRKVAEAPPPPTSVAPRAPARRRTPPLPARTRRRLPRTELALYGVAALLALLAIYLLFTAPAKEGRAVATDGEPPGPAASSVGAPPAGPIVSPSAHPPGARSADGAATEAPQPAPQRTQDLVACTAGLLAADAFVVERVVADFPCGEKSPVDGVERLTAALARGSGGRVTEATREWSNLGWYRAAAFAVARSRCCATPPQFQSPAVLDVCNLDAILEQLSSAAASGVDADLAVALKRYGAAATCVSTAGGGLVFRIKGGPTPEQAAILGRMIGRMRTSAPR